MRLRTLAIVLIPLIVAACGGGSTPTTPSANAVACTAIVLSSATVTQSAGGGATSITVTPTPSNCTWTATSNNAFLRITGQATNTGVGSFTFTTDPNTGNSERAGSIALGIATVNVTQGGVAPALVFTPGTPPNGNAGVPYNFNFGVAVGGVAPLTYSLDSGGFPPNGLILSPAGVLSGVPQAATPLGGLTFRVCVSDGAGNRRCSGDLQITIGPGAIGSWGGTITLRVGCTQPLPMNYPWTGTIRLAFNGSTELVISVPSALIFNDVKPLTIVGQRVSFSDDFGGIILSFVGDLSADFTTINNGTFTGTNCQIPPVVVIPSGNWTGAKR